MLRGRGMVEYTEAEQLAQIKRWWRQYGRYLLVAVIVGLFIGYGWRYYQQRKIQKIAAASVLYRQLMLAPLQFSLGDNAPAVVAANDIIKKYPNTAYADMSYLWLAKNKVLANKFPQAIAYLQQALSNSKDKITRQISRLRLAKLFTAQNDYSAALKVLDKVETKSYLPMIDSVKGDVYFAEKSWSKAKSSYIAAQNAYAAERIDDPMLAHKLSQLALKVAKTSGTKVGK